MFDYLLRRTLLMVPTLFGITLICFIIINLAPGSPVERVLSHMRFGNGMGGSTSAGNGISAEVIEKIKIQYGFDKPMHQRYLIWLKNLATLDFGESYSYQRSVLKVIGEKLSVSLQFGVVSLLVIYLICIPLGVMKALRDGSQFDFWSSVILLVSYSIPPLILGVLMRVYLAGGQFLDWLPLGELYSDNYFQLSVWGRIVDRALHFVMPLICYVVGRLTLWTFLMKNSMMDETRLDYVRTARAKGLSEYAVIFKHTLRNALVPILTGLGTFLTEFLAGSIVIETVFNLDGIGLLTYKSFLSRDYNVIMALIFIQSFLALIGRLLSDLTYVWVDPRMDFK